MHDLDRIEHALATKRLSSELFERCSQDMLSEVYVALSPIPGGTTGGVTPIYPVLRTRFRCGYWSRPRAR